jgi:hypothetical protein
MSTDEELDQWFYKIIKKDKFIMTEWYVSLGSYAEIDEFDSIEEMIEYVTDDFLAKMIAIRKYQKEGEDGET